MENDGYLLKGEDMENNDLELIWATTLGRRVKGRLYCLNEAIKQYGELKAIIITAVSSPLILLLIKFVYDHYLKGK